MMLLYKWGIEISPFQNYADEVDLAANRGHWWIQVGYPLMLGKLELFDTTSTRVKGICRITDRSMLHQIIMSTDEELEAKFVQPVTIKPGTERKPVPKKESATGKPVNSKDVTGDPVQETT